MVQACVLDALICFSSPQYRDMLTRSRADKKTAQLKLTDGELFMPDDMSIAESTSTWGVVNVDPVDSADPTEDLRLPSSRLPWAISEFEDYRVSAKYLLEDNRF
jgi:1-phosphatidylinositol-3-phosphate 5-kinase